ncbi:MAG: YIP1 family protein [Bryobacteraceae bacterium]
MPGSAPAPSSMSEVGRLAGIFWEPRPVFQDLAARPRFWVPLILMTLLSVVLVAAFSRIVGFEAMARRQIDASPRTAEMPAEQRERAIQMGMRFAVPSAYGGAAIGFTVMALVVAGVLLGSVNLFGGVKLRYPQAFSITCYSFLPSGLGTILALVVLLLKDPADFDLQNPLPLNLGAFLDRSAVGGFLHSLAGSIDLFSFWVILLLALGFSTAARKMPFGKALVLVLLPWGAYVLVKSALVGIMG